MVGASVNQPKGGNRGHGHGEDGDYLRPRNANK